MSEPYSSRRVPLDPPRNCCCWAAPTTRPCSASHCAARCCCHRPVQHEREMLRVPIVALLPWCATGRSKACCESWRLRPVIARIGGLAVIFRLSLGALHLDPGALPAVFSSPRPLPPRRRRPRRLRPAVRLAVDPRRKVRQLAQGVGPAAPLAAAGTAETETGDGAVADEAAAVVAAGLPGAARIARVFAVLALLRVAARVLSMAILVLA